MIRTLLHQELPWEDYVKSLLTPPYNKLSIEKMLTKRIEFHGGDDDKSVSGLIKLSDGNVMSLPGSLQPDERRMLEMAKIPKITVASKTLIFFQRFLVK